MPLTPPGEALKTVRDGRDVWEPLGEAGFTRSDVVVTVGGGATTDVGGFIAATWLRGVRVVHVPTTLLGMVDAAVGGKTGINTSAGKNLVGSFHEPAGVLVRPRPPRLAAPGGAGRRSRRGDQVRLRRRPRDPPHRRGRPVGGARRRLPQLREVIERAIQVKVDVVVGDLKETGGADGHPGREVLNYGHTMAHAVEKGTGYQVRHGEAVALGMVYVAELARLAGRLDDATAAGATARSCPPWACLPGSMSCPSRTCWPPCGWTRSRAARCCGSWCSTGWRRRAVLADPSEDHLRAAYDVLRGLPR